MNDAPSSPLPVEVAIGVLAWNEEEVIAATLRSVLEQSLFARLAASGQGAEIICVANGCTDRTAEVAAQALDTGWAAHPCRHSFSGRVANLAERGKTNAWNGFVHRLSDRRARVLIMMDADILLATPDTLWKMYSALQEHPEAVAAVDQPIKDVALKTRRTWRDRISLAASRLTGSGPAQLTGQLYAVRADVARDIYLPAQLLVEDGFLKALFCSDFLVRPVQPARIVQARDAAHIFEAYKSPRALVCNQKRQVIGQALVHLLVDKELKGWGRAGFAERLRQREANDPDWLRKLVAVHLRETRYFWRLFPGLLGFRFRRWAKLPRGQKWLHLPATLAGFALTLVASWLARRSLAQGAVGYWPDTRSPGLGHLSQQQSASFSKAASTALQPEEAR